MPAYYILYQMDQDVFYFSDAATIFNDLNAKYPDGNFPDNFTVRFADPLTTHVLRKLHGDIFHKGVLLRKLNEVLQVNLQRDTLSSSIVIDENQQVYSKEEKIRFIEKYGFLLLNKRKFLQIVDTEQQCHPLPEVSASFYFITGMAYYHRSQMYKALDNFKNAVKRKVQLNADLQSMLAYYYEMAKYALGIIGQEQIAAVIAGMKENNYLNLLFRIEAAYKQFSEDLGDHDESLKRFFDEVEGVKKDPLCDLSMEMIANSHILAVNGFDVNMRISQLLYDFRTTGVQTKAQQEAHEKLIQFFDGRASQLQQLALSQENMSTYYIVCINIVRTKYNYIALCNYIMYYNWESKRPEFNLSEDDIERITRYIKLLEEAADYFEEESFVENLSVALSIKAELHLFMDQKVEAQATFEKISDLIEANDMNSLRPFYEALVKGDTVHDKTLKQVTEIFNAMESVHTEAMGILKKIHDLNIAEKALNHPDTPGYRHIQLLPLGIFSYPKNKLWQLLKLINATDVARDQIKQHVEAGIVPVVNLFNNPVLREGPGNGPLDHKGIETDRHLLKVRQGLSDNRFYRVWPDKTSR